jgi:hypothetical protein
MILLRLAIKRDVLLALLPRSKPFRPQADGNSPARTQMLLQERWPRLARREVVTIEKNLETTRTEQLHESLCIGCISAAIAQEDIEGLILGHGDPFPCLRSRNAVLKPVSRESEVINSRKARIRLVTAVCGHNKPAKQRTAARPAPFVHSRELTIIA